MWHIVYIYIMVLYYVDVNNMPHEKGIQYHEKGIQYQEKYNTMKREYNTMKGNTTT
jgi:hypothetical protein